MNALENHVYIPALPCCDVISTYPNTNTYLAKIPRELRTPLVKVDPHGCQPVLSGLKALRSGGRSAIVIIDSIAYRLKGCGNYVNGYWGSTNLRYPFPGFPMIACFNMNIIFNGLCVYLCVYLYTYIYILLAKLFILIFCDFLKKMMQNENTLTGKIRNFDTFETDDEAVEIRGCAFTHTGINIEMI